MVSLLQCNVSSDGDRGGKVLASHRAQRAKKRTGKDPLRTCVQKSDGPLTSNAGAIDEIGVQGRGRGRTGFIPNTILEEDDFTEHDF